MKFIILLIMGWTLFSCSSHPVLPEKSDIKLTRDDPPKDCENLGAIEGRTTTIKSSTEDALEDLKTEAIKKGANYVQIQTMGAQGTAIRGHAFYCK